MIPSEDEWITLNDVALKFGKTQKTIHNYRTEGILNRSKSDKIKLTMFKTVRGYVTTTDEIKKFNEGLDT